MAKREKREEEQVSNEWMNTYSDMVTLLLCFFVLLIAQSTQDVDKMQALADFFNPKISILTSGQTVNDGVMVGNGISQMPDYEKKKEGQLTEEDLKAREEKEALEKMAADFQTYFYDKNISDKVEVSQEEKYVKITFKDGVLFDKSKADLKPEAIEILDILTEQILKYPEAELQIEGHADSDQIHTLQFPSNWHLSSARAISVAEYYINEKGFSPDSIAAIGYGEFRPVATNETVEGKALNRRVEMKIYRGKTSVLE